MSLALRWREVGPVRLRWVGPFEQVPMLDAPRVGGVAAIIGPAGASTPGGGPLPEGLLTEAEADGRYALATEALSVEHFELRTKVALFVAFAPKDLPERRLAVALTVAWSKPTLAERIASLVAWAREEAELTGVPTPPIGDLGPEAELEALIAIGKVLKPGLPKASTVGP